MKPSNYVMIENVISGQAWISHQVEGLLHCWLVMGTWDFHSWCRRILQVREFSWFTISDRVYNEWWYFLVEIDFKMLIMPPITNLKLSSYECIVNMLWKLLCIISLLCWGTVHKVQCCPKNKTHLYQTPPPPKINLALRATLNLMNGP